MKYIQFFTHKLRQRRQQLQQDSKSPIITQLLKESKTTSKYNNYCKTLSSWTISSSVLNIHLNRYKLVHKQESFYIKQVNFLLVK
jgi:hypothetical protein